MDKLLLTMKFWTDGYENSTRIRNVEYTWGKLKKLNDFFLENNINSTVKLYDFSPEKIIDESIHVPFELGSYMKAAKTNVIINSNLDCDFMFMFDCDTFFDEQDFASLLDLVNSLENGDFITFDLAKLDHKDSIFVIENDYVDYSFDWSYAYSGKKDNGPLCCGSKGALGGVYICDLNLLRQVGGFNEEYVGWGGEDSEIIDRISASEHKYRCLPNNKFSPFHLDHFIDWGNEKYNKRFNKMSLKTKFITAIYSDLHGTEFGGRPSRGGHYRWSLLSLLKMSDADFVCYTSDREIESLIEFFYIENNISENKLQFIVCDLSEIKHKDLIYKYKNVEETKNSDRCFEIQYNKFFWWWNEDKTYDYYFWIDAGLSYCGLIPEIYLDSTHSTKQYYDSSLFNNNFLSNLIKSTNDKFMLIGKENNRNYWCGTVNESWYKNYDRSLHIIGGLFGGHKDLWDNITSIFENYLRNILLTDKILYNEEVIMSLMYFNHKELFEVKEFDVWLHEDNYKDAPPEYFKDNKSFFKIFEDINNAI